jgi:hypothetical protein
MITAAVPPVPAVINHGTMSAGETSALWKCSDEVSELTRTFRAQIARKYRLCCGGCGKHQLGPQTKTEKG